MVKLSLPPGFKAAFGAAALLTITSACYAAEPKSTTVSNSAQAVAAVAAAQPGDTILLAPGDYTQLDLTRIKPAGLIRIASADPRNMARLQGLKVDGAANMVFSNLDIVLHPRTGYAVVVGGGASDIRIERSKIHGSKPSDAGGLGIFDSTNVAVVDNDFFSMRGGVGHHNNTNVLIQGNRFRDLQSDAVNGSNATNVRIEGNYFTDFYPASGHIDVIQFYKRGSDTSRNITVTGNLFVKGKGAAVQGIFIGNENKIPYENLAVTNNAIIGAQWHGISIDTVNEVTVTGNVVQGYAGQFAGSWLGVWGATNATIADNQATVFNLHSNKAVSERANKKIRAVKEGDASIVAKTALAGLMAPSP